MVLILDILQIPKEIVNLYQCSDQSRGHLNVQNSDVFGIFFLLKENLLLLHTATIVATKEITITQI